MWGAVRPSVGSGCRRPGRRLGEGACYHESDRGGSPGFEGPREARESSPPGSSLLAGSVLGAGLRPSPRLRSLFLARSFSQLLARPPPFPHPASLSWLSRPQLVPLPPSMSLRTAELGLPSFFFRIVNLEMSWKLPERVCCFLCRERADCC